MVEFLLFIKFLDFVALCFHYFHGLVAKDKICVALELLTSKSSKLP